MNVHAQETYFALIYLKKKLLLTILSTYEFLTKTIKECQPRQKGREVRLLFSLFELVA